MPPPILLNKPARMKKAVIVVSRSDKEQCIKVLQKTGLVHVIEKEKKVIEYLKLLDKIKRALDRIEYISSYLKGRVIDVKIRVLDVIELDYDLILKDVEDIYEHIRFLEDSLRRLREKKHTLESLHKILSLLPRSMPSSYIYFEGRFVGSKLVYGAISNVSSFLEDMKEAVVEYKATSQDQVVAIIVYPKNLEEELITKTRVHGVNIVQAPKELLSYKNIGEIIARIAEELRDISNRIQEIEKELRNYVDKVSNDVVKYRILLENAYNKIRSLSNVLSTKYLTVIEGWVPVKLVDKLNTALKESNIKAYVEYKDPDPVEEPPTLLDNPRIINFFEPIVKFLGVPRYNEWDPTPIISYSFALFYGLMLGDMGYAIALLLITFFLLDKLAGYSESPDYIKFKKAFIVSNIVGFIVGLTSGAFLGNVSEYIIINGISLKTILIETFSPLSNVFNDPLTFLIASIIIGLIHVNIAHGIALAKFIKNRSIGDVLSEVGLFIAEIFGIPYVMFKMLHASLPFISESNASLFLYGSLLGVLLVIVGMIKSMGGLGMLMWIFNLTGLLGDVLSYCRIAGVGMATVYLAQSFNKMAIMAYAGVESMVGGGLIATILGAIVLVFIAGFGHLINTALSAIGAFVHSLRLCFVEFLTKFYEGTGYPFEPLRVIIRRRVVIE